MLMTYLNGFGRLDTKKPQDSPIKALLKPFKAHYDLNKALLKFYKVLISLISIIYLSFVIIEFKYLGWGVFL
jgi:hypothetical protein